MEENKLHLAGEVLIFYPFCGHNPILTQVGLI